MANNLDQKINYLELPAADLNIIKQFYKQAFDWNFQDFGSAYTAFSDGTINGGFFYDKKQSTTANGAALIVLYAENLEATQAKVERCGGTINRKIFSFPGGRRFHFLDPNGNELAIWSNN